MQYINLPEAHEVRGLSFYLAMEEYVARHMDTDDCSDRTKEEYISGRLFENSFLRELRNLKIV